MGKCIMSGIVPQLKLPPRLSDFAEGSLIKINENSSPVEFYVAKHNYEQELNGAGRTLVVRKDCYDTRTFGSNNAYATSTLDSWLNGDYKNLLDSAVQTLIGTTKFYYTIGNGVVTVTTLQRAVFQLSFTELGKSANAANTEGSALPIASILQIAYRNGTAVVQWTRTPATGDTDYVHALGADGNAASGISWNHIYGSRPCFTLPANTKIDDNGLVVA